jgi:hypothetical protein
MRTETGPIRTASATGLSSFDPPPSAAGDHRPASVFAVPLDQDEIVRQGVRSLGMVSCPYGRDAATHGARSE